MARRVMLTGACGYIASLLLPAFRERYDLVLVDVRSTDREGRPVEGVQEVDLLHDPEEKVRPLFSGVEVVVHCAYVGRPSGAGKTYDLERPNLDLAARMYQLAWEEGVRRFVFASSNHATDWYERLYWRGEVEWVRPQDFPLSDNFYGWGKIAVETLGFLYACGALGRPMEVVCIRIGGPREPRFEAMAHRPQAIRRALAVYISQRDLQQLFLRAIEAEDIRDPFGVPFLIVYGVSDNARRFWDLTHARRVLGYAPADDSEERFAQEIRQHLHASQENAEG